jgi:glycosyltransferase involved in cell wall biosynthesis
MSKDIKVSIVTPSYNQGEFLERTIESVINQEYPNIEYIIIDGGSNDESVEIIKKFEPKIDYWHSKPDRGQSDAINTGFSRAKGDLLCWLNSDDTLNPGAINHVVNIYVKNKFDFYYSDADLIDCEDRVIKRIRKRKEGRRGE